jgi:hypothetical protein
MDRLESAARALAGLSVGSPDLAPGTRSARRSLAWSCEVAMAVAGAGRGAEAIAWAKYAGNSAYAPRLADALTVEATKWPEAMSVAKRRKLRATSAAAVDEWMAPPQCPKCCGTGAAYRKVGGALMQSDCAACEGAGYRELSVRARSRMVGVHVEDWRRHFAEVHGVMLKTLRAWDATLLRHVRRRL